MIQKKMILGSELALHLSICDELWVAVALISDKGYTFIQENIFKEAKQHYLIGIDLPSSPKVMTELMDSEDGEIFNSRVYHRKGDFFHPKVYITRKAKQLTAFVSSGNCTEGGMSRNREMTIKTDDENTCLELLKWFNTLFRFGFPITKDFLDHYTAIYPARVKRIEQDQQEVEEALDENDAGENTLDGIDFTNQFFKREHYDAFTGNKPTLQEEATNLERMATRNRLFDLHFRIAPMMRKKKWDLHEHYVAADTVSSAIHSEFTANALTGIWLHYGRNKKAIKSFGDDYTPIDFMRMQVILHKDTLGIWNRVGKDNGSKIDREYFRQQMTMNVNYRQNFYQIISSLPLDYFIRIRDEYRYVNEFTDEATLTDYVLKDHPGYYFIIGVEITPGDPGISNDRIVQTVIHHFENLYPTYELIKFNG